MSSLWELNPQFMRVESPAYALKPAADPQLMRGSVPHLCVENYVNPPLKGHVS